MDPGENKGDLQLQQPKEEKEWKPRASPKKLPMKTSSIPPGHPAGNLGSVGGPSTSTAASIQQVKSEVPEDFAFDEPPLKKIKSATCPQGNPIKYAASAKSDEEHKMNWDIVQRTGIEEWVCANIIRLFNDDNTIPFIARYRKELINNLEADALREVQQTLEELYSVAKKVHGSIQKLKKEGKLSEGLLTALLNCKTLEELDHVADVEGLSTIEDVKSGVQHILADMIAKDRETLDFIRDLCQRKYICIQSSLAKVTAQKANEKDVNKFHLYQNFSCNIRNIQHHQTIVDGQMENKWRPKAYAKPELMELLRDSVEDSYKRLIYPLLCREFRSKLTSDAEKESVMMFGRNLRQLLLTSPVRGRTLMGVDPGYKHGCKLAIVSPTSQILHTDIVYLHSGRGFHEAQKIRKLLLDYNCGTVVIGNGTACRETEAYFADLIMKKYFAPLDVTYWMFEPWQLPDMPLIGIGSEADGSLEARNSNVALIVCLLTGFGLITLFQP
ncbi:hypothetical protein JD844_025381 [Phrynosoma platyrhinos]|uniref:YqgF/RNase H-like domain-containing protein n=1 Tax=Phrynosoma platyrhinos TaxID=52577 RepID=A0ABQ7SZT5_PHRPL|nr:hypothetical protein JD844_025381 [Phrynosoma platyrhinos]